MGEDKSTTADEALDILKRLEPALAGLASRMTGIETRMTNLETRMGALEVGVANLQGRVSQLPTAWAMFTAIVVLIFTVMGGTVGILALARTFP